MHLSKILRNIVTNYSSEDAPAIYVSAFFSQRVIHIGLQNSLSSAINFSLISYIRLQTILRLLQSNRNFYYL